MELFKNKVHIQIALNFLIIINLVNICTLKDDIFLNIRKVSSDKFSVLLKNGLYIYNSDFSKEINKFLFKDYEISNNNDNIIFHSLINYYSFCLINEKIIIYNEKENIFNNYNYNDYDTSKKNIYNAIPYIKNEKLNFILIFENEYKTFSFRIFFCISEKTHYKIIFSIGTYTNQKYEFKNINFNDDKLSMSKPICHLNSNSNQIKCFYYRIDDSHYLSYVIFNINNQKTEQSKELINININDIRKIESSISKNNKILICFLFNNPKDYTYCFINNFSSNSYNLLYYTFDYCEDIKALYFEEINQFIFLCKKSDKFVLKYINDSNNTICNKTEKIFIQCKEGKKYEGAFGLIYNNSFNYFNLITDYNFTSNEDCYFSYPEKQIPISGNLTNYTNTSIIEETEEEEEDTVIFHIPDINIEIPNNYTINKEEEEDEINEIALKIVINNKNEIIKGVGEGENIEIETKKFKLTIQPTNSTNKNSTFIDFTECEKLLRIKNNISNSSVLTFFQMEINNNKSNALVNQLKYSVYDENGVELDLSLCEDMKTKISFSIKNNTNLDLSSVSDFKSKGYDILNIKDKFFTDLCESYSDSGNDMILSDRIKFLYKNYLLCEEGCSYNNIDIQTQKIICDCKIQGNMSSITKSLSTSESQEISFLNSNIAVVVCYNLVFNLKNKLNNIGFIIFLGLFILNIIFLIIYAVKGIKPVKDYLNKEMKKNGYLDKQNISNPNKRINPKNKTKRKKSNINKILPNKINNLITNNETKKSTNLHNTNIHLNLNNKKNNKNNDDDKEENYFGIIRINLNNIKEYYPKDSNQTLHNYTFEEAIKYDKRNIFRICFI